MYRERDAPVPAACEPILRSVVAVGLIAAKTALSPISDQTDGGLIPALEIMVPTPAIRRAIRDNETHLLAGMIETGKSFGMRSMDGAIAELVVAGKVALDDALAKVINPDKLTKIVV